MSSSSAIYPVFIPAERGPAMQEALRLLPWTEFGRQKKLQNASRRLHFDLFVILYKIRFNSYTLGLEESIRRNRIEERNRKSNQRTSHR